MTDRPRILVVSPRFPLPLESGTQLRVYHSLRVLAARFDVTLVSLVQDGEGADRVDDIEALGVDVRTVSHTRTKLETLLRYPTSRLPYRVTRFATSSFRSAVERCLKDRSFDAVWVHFLGTLATVPSCSCEVILDEHNADMAYWESFRSGSVPERLFAVMNQRRLYRFQRRHRDRLDAVLSVSEPDAEATRTWAECPVHVVPNGVDIDEFTPVTSASDAGATAVFVGSLDVRMNVEAISWFVNTAWPSIRTAHPEATFRIVGRSPSDRVLALDEVAGVDVVGRVPDVRPYYDEAGVVVTPFQFGGGTKLKLLEAMSMERGIVTTPVGSTGIAVEDGVHALVRERGDGFTDAVEALFADPERRSRLGANGRTLVESNYAWDTIMTEAIEQVSPLFA